LAAEGLAAATIAAFGLASIAIASMPPALAFAGRSSVDRGLALGAGLALLTIAAAEWRGVAPAPAWRWVVACLAWFVAGWTNPGSGSALVFTIGLIVGAAWPAALLDAVTSDRLRGRDGRWREALVAIAYAVNVLMLGFVPAVLDSPRSAGCALCPADLVQWTSQPALAGLLARVGLSLSTLWALAGSVWLGVRLVRVSPAGRVPALLLTGPAIVVLGLWVATATRSIPAGGPLLDEPGERVWQAGAIAIVAIAAGRLAERWRVRRVRTRVSRIVLDLASAPHGAGLRDRLDGLLDDPGLVLAYPVGPDRLVDHAGQPVRIEPDASRTVSPIVRDGELVAMLGHRRELADDPDRLAELIDAARLGLEAERLRAVAEAALGDLRASRERVVAVGDAERRRLERDLHDTAQQRLVSLAIRARRLRSRLAGLADRSSDERAQRAERSVALLDEADAGLRGALEQIREVAHGIDPAALSEDGLAAGIEDLVEGSTAFVVIDAVPRERLDRPVEIAVFLIAREATRQPAGRHARIRNDRSERMIRALVEHDGDPPELGDLEDRIGALDGTIGVRTSDDGRVLI
jgi:signal transduction histidine kinase